MLVSGVCKARVLGLAVAALVGGGVLRHGFAQQQPPPDGPGQAGRDVFRRGPGGPGGFGGPGGPMREDRKILKQYDKDNNGYLDKAERAVAREALKKEREAGGGQRRFGPPRGFGLPGQQFAPGPRVSPDQVPVYPNASLYDTSVLRTIFLEFENPDWEAELTDFHGTDVEVPATMIVDGKKYPNVGVRYRGTSSYMMVPEGGKKAFNISVDYVDPKQRLYGYRTLNLLNCNGDPSMLKAVLYSHIYRQFQPAPQANFVKVVINGESWGVFPSIEQFNKDFLKHSYPSTKGDRWKTPGSPRGNAGLVYMGDDPAAYRRLYEIKSDDNPQAWSALIHLCRTLNQAPLNELEDALKPMLDIDSVLWFLAMEIVFVNDDGYWTRASDYSLYRDEKGVFHVIPHDFNETFHGGRGGPGMFAFPGGPGAPGAFPPAGGPGGFGPPGGPQDGPPPQQPGGQPLTPVRADGGVQGPGAGQPQGDRAAGEFGRRGDRAAGEFGRRGDRGPGGMGPGGMGPGGGGVNLDPLVGLEDRSKPLRSRLLAVPALRERYLRNVRTLATVWLDWNRLGPLVAQYSALIDKEVQADTRKLAPYEAFRAAVSGEAPGTQAVRGESLRAFAEQRRAYLLNHPEIKKLPQ